MARARRTRALRGTIAAAVATFTALLGHVIGGGDVPGWLGIVAPLVLSTSVSVFLIGSRLSVVRLTAVVAVSQALFHALFVLGTPVVVTGGAHHHGVAPALPASAPAAPADTTMWAGHALAVVLTVAVLHRGESALRALAVLAALLVAALARALAAPVVVRPAAGPLRIAETPQRPAPRGRVVDLAPRRGPPLLAH